MKMGWRRGGVNVRHGKVSVLILNEDGSEEDGGGDFLSVCNDMGSGFAGSVCAPNLLLGILVRPPVI
jgi:hypothetical protein